MSFFPLRERYREAAEDLAVRVSDGRFPIVLSEVAKHRGVRGIEFRPLPVDGLLGFADGAFRIFLNAPDAKMATQLQQALTNEAMSPLPPRTRFTLAHEIAHTFLFEIKNDKPTPTTKRELTEIERFCNSIAASFLMPKELLRKLITKLDLVEPSALRHICDEVAASPEALIYRLFPVGDWINESVAFGCIRDNGSGFEFQDIVAHGRISSVLPQLKRGYACSKLVRDRRFVWNGGGDCSIKVRLKQDGSDVSEDWTVRCEPISRLNRRDRYFATVVRS